MGKSLDFGVVGLRWRLERARDRLIGSFFKRGSEVEHSGAISAGIGVHVEFPICLRIFRQLLQGVAVSMWSVSQIFIFDSAIVI